jgi:hypothetical protein
MILTGIPAWGGEPDEGMGKNLCLLYSEGCPNRASSIQEIIARLQTEIGRGEAVYTPVELQRLNYKLKEARFTLHNLNFGQSHGHHGR